jgi:hypothetical protein
MRQKLICVVIAVVLVVPAFGAAMNVDLGTAGNFAVLGGSAVTNTGPTVLNGDLGVWPGSSITGFPPGLVNPLYATEDDNAVAMQAQSDLTTAYNFAAGEACGVNLSGQDLGGMILTPGVYCYTSAGPAAQLTGTLTLNDLGNPNAVFVFQIASTLTTATDSSVVFSAGLQDDNVYWQVGSSATLGTGTTFQGNILANTSITFVTDATITCGSALASGGAVTLDTNTVSIDSSVGCLMQASGTPEPGTAGLVSLGGLLGVGLLSIRSRRKLRF